MDILSHGPWAEAVYKTINKKAKRPLNVRLLLLSIFYSARNNQPLDKTYPLGIIKIMKQEKQILIALKKAESNLNNVIEMTESKKYCIDILQQNLSVIGLLKSANNKLLKQHLNNCFKTAMRGTNEKRKKKMINEILQIENLINK